MAASSKKAEVKWGWILVVVAIFVVSFFVPAPAGLSVPGKQSLFLLLIGLVLTLTNALPIGLVGFLLLVLINFMGVGSMSDAFGNYANASTWFILISFALAEVMCASSLAKRVLVFMLNVFKGSTRKLILGTMFGTMAISMIISDIPAAAIPMSFMLVLLNQMEDGPERSRMAKATMIGIPFASMMGGLGTPIGSIGNIFAIEQLSQNAGIELNFLQWMAFGIPFAIIGTILSYFSVILIFNPPEISAELRNKFVEDAAIKDKLSRDDVTLLAVFSGMMVLWFLSSWVPILNTTAVAMLGMIILCLPKIGVTNFTDVMKNVSWGGFFLGTGFGSVAALTASSGAAKWVVDLVNIPSGINVILLLTVIGLVVAVLHLPIPTGPVLIKLLSPALIGVCATIGMHPVVMIVALGIFATMSMLLPFDSVPLVTYSKNFYSVLDYAKGGVVTTVVITVVTAILVPIIARLLGFV